MNDIQQMRINELEMVTKILAAWPFIETNTRNRIAEYYEIRYPNFHQIIKKISDPQILIPKGYEFDFLVKTIEKCFHDQDTILLMTMNLLAESSQVNSDLKLSQAPYNTINIQRNLIHDLREYLAGLYKGNSKFILDEIRKKFPELCDQTNEMIVLNKIYYLDVDESPANFKELVQHAKHKFEQGISFVVSTGYSGIDQKINEGGYVPKRLTVLEAKTGLGKTSFISQTLCETAIRHRQGVLLLSFEMDTESIMYRMLSQATQIPAKDVIKMLESATGPTSQVAEIIEQLDKFISIKYPDNTGDVNYIESQILSYIRTYDCVPAIVVIDYIQQLTMGKSGRFTSQSDELTTISRTIRGFAQQYNTHIIVTSQVMETSDGISRSFGASGIEFAADHVLVLSKSQTDINKRILKFKKNRFGPSGDEIELFWNSKITSFFEIDSYNVNLEVDQKNLMTSSTYGKKGEFFGNVNQQERIPF